MARVNINLSKNLGIEYFEDIKNNPSKYLQKFRVEAIHKERSNFKFNSFTDEISLVNSAKNGTLKVKLSERKGYFNIEFNS